MRCKEIKELLSLYIDRMLDESQTAEVEEHLSSCDSCRKEYNEMKEIIDLLGQSEMVPVPDAFSMRLKRALKEEKQNMIDAGTIGKPLKKKPQWRMITSVAAAFAVGVITLSLYADVLGILPDRLNGGDQTDAAPEAAAEYDLKDGKTGISEDAAGNTNHSNDSSANMQEDLDGLQQAATENTDSAADAEEQLYGYSRDMNDTALENEASAKAEAPIYEIAAAGSEQDSAEESNGGTVYDMPADSGEQETADAGEGSSGNFERNSRLESPLDECSRSLTSSGVERNAAAVQFYNNLIEERLEDFDYQILESRYAQTGEWLFRVFIFRGQDGNTYNEEILISGKDGEIEVTCSNQFMGL